MDVAPLFFAKQMFNLIFQIFRFFHASIKVSLFFFFFFFLYIIGKTEMH